MNFHAHTATGLDGCPAAEAHWQLLKDHLRGVADFARAFARPLGIEAHAEWCGLHHDLGKYAVRFQARLRSPATVHGINHWAAGAVRAWKDRAHLPALVIDGHHTGIPALGEFRDTAARVADAKLWHSLTGCPESFGELIARMAEDGIASDPPPPRARLIVNGKPCAFAEAMWTRMLFSCLVDADFLEDRMQGEWEEREPF